MLGKGFAKSSHNFYSLKKLNSQFFLLYLRYTCFFYKHMKFRIQALCLAIYDFEARIMLSLCLTFQGTRLPVWKKFNSNVAAKCDSVFKFRDLLIYKLSKRKYALVA